LIFKLYEKQGSLQNCMKNREAFS